MDKWIELRELAMGIESAKLEYNINLANLSIMQASERLAIEIKRHKTLQMLEAFESLPKIEVVLDATKVGEKMYSLAEKCGDIDTLDQKNYIMASINSDDLFVATIIGDSTEYLVRMSDFKHALNKYGLTHTKAKDQGKRMTYEFQTNLEEHTLKMIPNKQD